jgi:hypothetical protein
MTIIGPPLYIIYPYLTPFSHTMQTFICDLTVYEHMYNEFVIVTRRNICIVYISMLQPVAMSLNIHQIFDSTILEVERVCLGGGRQDRALVRILSCPANPFEEFE